MSVLYFIVISRRVSQKYCQFYTYGKITIKKTSIQLTEFVNKTSIDLYIDDATNTVRSKKGNFWDKSCIIIG